MPDAQLKKDFIENPEKKGSTEKNKNKIPDSYVENMTAEDMITEFPRLVRGGQFANALVVIQGHARFLWFYELVEKITRLLFRKEDKSQAAAKKTTDVHSLVRKRLPGMAP
jgi:hypothetical protein